MPTVAVDGHDVELECRAGETIMGSLSRHGFTYRIGCRRGGCGFCKVDLLSGEVEYNKVVSPTVLSEAERESGVCLSCRAVPVTDVVIRLSAGDKLRRTFFYGTKTTSGPQTTGTNIK